MNTPKLIDADVLYECFEKAEWYDNKDRDFVAEKILLSQSPVEVDARSLSEQKTLCRCSKCRCCGAVMDLPEEYREER